jgi:hypothetical protein
MALLVVILAVLIAGGWLGSQFKENEKLQQDRGVLLSKKQALLHDLAELERKSAARSKEALQLGARVRRDMENEALLVERLRARQQKIRVEHSIAQHVPLSEPWQQIRLLDMEIASSQGAIDLAVKASESRQKAVQAIGQEVTRRKREIQSVDAELYTLDERLGKSPVRWLETAVYPQLRIALWILLAAILTPFALKLLWYFVIAPLATSRPPVRLMAKGAGGRVYPSMEGAAEDYSGRMSAVSQQIVLGERQQLLIQPEYLQSTSLQAKKKTKWFMNAALPFTSVLSGMYMLTKIGPAGSGPVVISATRDPLSEVGIVTLAPGAAFVCQPRSLAGVIQDADAPIHISRHWRLGSLQAWLTLQLRFLVFHGPGQLVIKGCRGIRIERAGAGRLINQAATLGFSAELGYANTRCETFVSYWTGKEDLFNDLFTGEGVYVYEEMPALKRSTGITGRGLEGVSDAVLKVFGV